MSDEGTQPVNISQFVSSCVKLMHTPSNLDLLHVSKGQQKLDLLLTLLTQEVMRVLRVPRAFGRSSACRSRGGSAGGATTAALHRANRPAASS